jgi:hypothetical protein
MKIVGEVMVEALLSRKDELDVSFETLDHVAGLREKRLRYRRKMQMLNGEH